MDSTDNPAIAGYATGFIGHLLFHASDPAARGWLERGREFYPGARSDLGDLLVAAGERDAGIAVWREGVAQGEVASVVPLANLLWDQGDRQEAIDLLERFKDEDLFARENLEIMKDEHGD